MFSFVFVIAISFCAPIFPSAGNIVIASACLENIVGASSLNITCRSRSESCDPPQGLAPKKVCNDGLRCIMIKNDHEYRCALIDEINENKEDEKVFNFFVGSNVEGKVFVVVILLIIVLIAILSLYLYNLCGRGWHGLCQQQVHPKKNKTIL
jgi:hypothetical protein